ncbi:UNVERIFIED_CONTAM: Presenilin-1 [Siphonaria sp. JEL0065]|nr:Presenilin-1 [Siphonaria sp. JEL0065]
MSECQLKDWGSHQQKCGTKPPSTSGGSRDQESEQRPGPTTTTIPDQQAPPTAAPAEKRKRRKRPKPVMKISENSFELDDETVEELRFYLIQIYMILKPVIICISLSVLWMKLTNPPTQYFNMGVGNLTPNIYAGGVDGVVAGGTNAKSGEVTGDLTSALIIISQIIVATIIIYLLFRYNCMKILIGFFGFIVVGLLGMFGWVLGTTLLSIYGVPFDWISFMFLLWNLAAVGVVSIFWKGPLLLQQAYMVFMSTLMALSLSSLPAVTSWILLALLAVWAVLCPYGPLRLLIEHSQQNNRDIPALLYTAGPTTMMASPPSRPLSAEISQTSHTQPTYIQGPSEFLQATSAERDESLFTTDSCKTSTAILNSVNQTQVDDAPAVPGEIEIRPQSPSTGITQNPSASPATAEILAMEEEDDGGGSGMKLGLGDFVFYSVLSSRAALLDWVSTMNVVIAVITGLNATIFLLVLFQKALPALPISIIFGLLFYFVSYLTLVPFVNQLTNMPVQFNVTVAATGSALWAGRGGGAGLIYV